MEDEHLKEIADKLSKQSQLSDGKGGKKKLMHVSKSSLMDEFQLVEINL